MAVLSWNRLHYLRATLESAYPCINYPDIEWIVSDNESDEPGLRKYIDSLDWVQQKIFRRQSHADAMNELVSRAQGNYILIRPEDFQFIVVGDWMQQLVELLEANAFIGSVGIDALRQATLSRVLAPVGWQDRSAILREIYRYGRRFRRQQVLKGRGGVCLHSLGFRSSGICGSGIPTLTRTDVWRQLGPWKCREELSTGLVDSSGGAEIDMYRRFHLSRLPLQSAVMHIPVAADILTDPLGCKAKVRGNRRYGVYMPARSPDGLYYKIHQQSEIPGRLTLPLSFKDIVVPIGFSIPTDASGDRKKFPINDSIVYDIKERKYVDYPLADGL